MNRQAVVTGVGRRRGIAAAITRTLLQDGWDVAITWWAGYDARQDWGTDPETVPELRTHAQSLGRNLVAIEANLEDLAAATTIFQAAGPSSALICCHCECLSSSTTDTTVESFDRHYAVNVRATWLLIQQFAHQIPDGPGRIITLTSDHVVGNLPYGATKAAADRVTLAAAHDLAHLGITANAINPGPVDTGWMNDDHRAHAAQMTPLKRHGTAQDTADLVRFLCSDQGGWITAQLLMSNGGFTSTIP